MDVFSAMDVTVYPPPPQPLAAPDHTRLGQLSYPDPAFGTNKVSKERRSLHGCSVSQCLGMNAMFVMSCLGHLCRLLSLCFPLSCPAN